MESPKIVWRIVSDPRIWRLEQNLPSQPGWPAGWPVPRIGDEVRLGAIDLTVRHVTWYPNGEDGSDPFVYVVLTIP
jgi:hypothetical protein